MRYRGDTCSIETTRETAQWEFIPGRLYGRLHSVVGVHSRAACGCCPPYGRDTVSYRHETVDTVPAPTHTKTVVHSFLLPQSPRPKMDPAVSSPRDDRGPSPDDRSSPASGASSRDGREYLPPTGGASSRDDREREYLPPTGGGVGVSSSHHRKNTPSRSDDDGSCPDDRHSPGDRGPRSDDGSCPDDRSSPDDRGPRSDDGSCPDDRSSPDGDRGPRSDDGSCPDDRHSPDDRGSRRSDDGNSPGSRPSPDSRGRSSRGPRSDDGSSPDDGGGDFPDDMDAGVCSGGGRENHVPDAEGKTNHVLEASGKTNRGAEGKICFVLGAQGSGKTALIHELDKRLRRRDNGRDKNAQGTVGSWDKNHPWCINIAIGHRADPERSAHSAVCMHHRVWGGAPTRCCHPHDTHRLTQLRRKP